MTGPTPDGTVTIHPLHGIPEVRAGDRVGRLLLDALRRSGLSLTDGDVLVVSSKVVSKALGLRADVDDRAVEVLRQSHRVVAERSTPTGVTRIVEALAGPVMAGAGIDGSNTGEDGRLLLLPTDPDLAAREVYADLLTAAAPHALPRIGIIVTDTAGRAWRAGQTDFALGACAVEVLEDLRGSIDVDGRPLAVTARAVGDEIAAAADLVKGKARGVPAALVRGVTGAVADPGAAGARRLVRAGRDDWFALGAVEAVRTALGVPPGSASADQVGVPSVGQEEYAVRLARAVRLALHGEGEAQVDVVDVVDLDGGGVDGGVSGGGVDGGGDGWTSSGGRLVVRAVDPVLAGRVCARLEVALVSEGLDGVVIEVG